MFMCSISIDRTHFEEAISEFLRRTVWSSIADFHNTAIVDEAKSGEEASVLWLLRVFCIERDDVSNVKKRHRPSRVDAHAAGEFAAE